MVSPSDLRSPGLARRFRGSDRATVEQLLSELAGKLEDAEAGRDSVRERCSQLESELAERKSLDRELRETMVAAQRDIETMELDTKREAASIRERARLDALEVDAGLEEEHAAVAARLAEVRAIELRLRVRSRELVEATLVELSEATGPSAEVEPAVIAEVPVAEPSIEDTQAIALPLLGNQTEPAIADSASTRVEEEDTLAPSSILEPVPARSRRRSYVLSFAILLVGTLVAVGIWQLSSAEGASKASASVRPATTTSAASAVEPVPASPGTDQVAESTADSAIIAETVRPIEAARPEPVKLAIAASGGDCWLQVRRGSATGKLLYDGFSTKATERRSRRNGSGFDSGTPRTRP